MPLIPGYPHLLHGGDYNPDQWQRYPEVVDEDFRLMDRAGCNAFSVGIFAWSRYEREEGRFDFDWMDDLFDRAEKNGKRLFLATPSGARPSWLAVDYPETGRVDAHGRREPWQTRHNHCWTSPVMRDRNRRINRLLAERYGRRPALAGWHISNEYSGACHCADCRARFADFLRERYGDLDRLNDAYWSAFWSHTVTDWRQVNPLDPCSDTGKLDWLRFNTRQLTDYLRFEIATVRESSDAPATTNMMGFFPHVDYWRVAEACDFVADDCYPFWRADPADVERTAIRYSMMHDLHQSMKRKPFLMMESCPGTPNYNPHPRLRRPGELEREALLALGHGADGIMYFQWRKGLGGCEKIHGAVVGHDGTDRTWTFRQVADLGRRLAAAAPLADAVASPSVAVVYDWESRWALATTSGFGDSAGRFDELVARHYGALWRRSVPTAVIESRCDFSPYKLLVLPMLFMIRDDVAARLRRFVEDGGTVLMTCLSGYVDEDNRCFRGGNPGGPALRSLFGIWNEDIDGLAPDDRQSLIPVASWLPGGRAFAVARMAEWLHAEGAEVLAVYGHDLLKDAPALTRNPIGRGRAYYLGAEPEAAFLDPLYDRLLAEAGVRPALAGLPDGVHAAHRAGADADFYALANLTAAPITVALPRPFHDLWNQRPDVRAVTLPPNGGTLLSESRSERP